MAVLARIWPYLLAITLALAALYGSYRHGVTVTEQEWQAERDENTRLAQQAVILQQQEERKKEQDMQDKLQGVQRDAIETINQIRADAAANASIAQRVRDKANMLATAASAGCQGATTTAGGDSATKAAMVLSDMYVRDNKRLAELAVVYDETLVAAQACRAAYDSVRQIKSPR